MTTVIERPGDKYILPAGEGSKDGSSWQNALDGNKGLQCGWDELQPEQTLWIGRRQEAPYANKSLIVLLLNFLISSFTSDIISKKAI